MGPYSSKQNKKLRPKLLPLIQRPQIMQLYLSCYAKWCSCLKWVP